MTAILRPLRGAAGRVALALAALAAQALQPAQAATPSCTPLRRGGDVTDPALVALADGSFWYATMAGNRLVRFGPDGRESAVVPVDAATTRLSGLALGPDGQLWYSKDAGFVGRIPPGGGQGTEYAVGQGPGHVRDIVAGPDGAMWFHDPVRHLVGRIATDGTLRSFAGPTMNGYPFAAQGLVASGGQLWLSVRGHNAIYRVSPDGVFQRLDIATPGAHPQALAAAPDGGVWFTMTAVRKLGRITPDGQIREIDLGKTTPTQLTVARDGTLWFTSSSASVVGSVSPSGEVQSFRCGSNPTAIVQGSDGRLRALGNNQMLLIDPAPQAVAAAVTATAAVPAPPPGAVPAVGSDELQRLIASHPGRLVVQVSSYDERCPYCARANPAFDSLAATPREGVRYVRIHREPWLSTLELPAVKAMGLAGLPTTLVYEGGRESRRVQGHWPQDKLAQDLFGPR